MDQATLEAVVRRARAGDPEAFADLHRLLYRRVFGLCRHLLGSGEDAEDAASEVFMKAQRGIAGYDSAKAFPAWLLSIASHHCLDLLRRRRVEQRVFEAQTPEWYEPEAAGPTPLKQLLDAEQKAAVRAALDELPQRTRLALVLRYESGFSYDQIAEALSLNRNHVATLIFRGKKDLRRSLEPLLKEARQ